jgi:hypothetical protein
VERRAEERAELLRLRAALQAQGESVKVREFKPKFSYIESQEKEGGERVEAD